MREMLYICQLPETLRQFTEAWMHANCPCQLLELLKTK